MGGGLDQWSGFQCIKHHCLCWFKSHQLGRQMSCPL